MDAKCGILGARKNEAYSWLLYALRVLYASMAVPLMQERQTREVGEYLTEPEPAR